MKRRPQWAAAGNTTGGSAEAAERMPLSGTTAMAVGYGDGGQGAASVASAYGYPPPAGGGGYKADAPQLPAPPFLSGRPGMAGAYDYGALGSAVDVAGGGATTVGATAGDAVGASGGGAPAYASGPPYRNRTAIKPRSVMLAQGPWAEVQTAIKPQSAGL